MVRLKEQSGYTGSAAKFISIPYGAIKSYCKQFLECHIFIFQFLMVRLKVSQNLVGCNNKLISIPYGAIKSFPLH